MQSEFNPKSKDSHLEMECYLIRAILEKMSDVLHKYSSQEMEGVDPLTPNKEMDSIGLHLYKYILPNVCPLKIKNVIGFYDQSRESEFKKIYDALLFGCPADRYLDNFYAINADFYQLAPKDISNLLFSMTWPLFSKTVLIEAVDFIQGRGESFSAQQAAFALAEAEPGASSSAVAAAKRAAAPGSIRSDAEPGASSSAVATLKRPTASTCALADAEPGASSSAVATSKKAEPGASSSAGATSKKAEPGAEPGAGSSNGKDPSPKVGSSSVKAATDKQGGANSSLSHKPTLEHLVQQHKNLVKLFEDHASAHGATSTGKKSSAPTSTSTAKKVSAPAATTKQAGVAPTPPTGQAVAPAATTTAKKAVAPTPPTGQAVASAATTTAKKAVAPTPPTGQAVAQAATSTGKKVSAEDAAAEQGLAQDATNSGGYSSEDSSSEESSAEDNAEHVEIYESEHAGAGGDSESDADASTDTEGRGDGAFKRKRTDNPDPEDFEDLSSQYFQKADFEKATAARPADTWIVKQFACMCCRKSKERCDMTYPCLQCTTRGTKCCYNTNYVIKKNKKQKS